MDPVTHAVAGALVARAGLAHRVVPSELERRGVIWTAAFALAPDLDAIAEFSSDPLAFVRYHRGLTHSLLGGAALALVLALVFGRLFPGVPRRRVLALTATGVYLHIFLDLLTSYGTVLLYPFQSTRFTLDWLWTVDPTFTGILLGGVLAVYLLRRAPRLVAKAGLSLALAYILLCGSLQWHARQAIAAEAAALEIEGIQQIAALPAPLRAAELDRHRRDRKRLLPRSSGARHRVGCRHSVRRGAEGRPECRRRGPARRRAATVAGPGTAIQLVRALSCRDGRSRVRRTAGALLRSAV